MATGAPVAMGHGALRMHRLRAHRAGRAAVLLALAVAGAAGCHRAPRPVMLAAPEPSVLTRIGPDSFVVRLATSRGPADILVRRHWAPLGADRVHLLVQARYYDGVRFFRVLPGFVAQFGLHGDSAVNAAWRPLRLVDDSVRITNQRGTMTFATGGPATRTTQLFINTRDNARLDAMGFAPVGQVMAGMDAIDSLYAGYGEGAPRGKGPEQGRIAAEGNRYLRAEFPKLDSIVTARVIRSWGPRRR